MVKNRSISPKFVLAVMLIGTFVASASQSMLAASLPAIMDTFQIDATLGQVLTTFDIFTVGIVAALSAFLITRFNTRYLFLGSLTLFLVGCVGAYFAQQYWVLLVSRILQACGAGVLLPLNQVAALDIYPKNQSGRALGLVGFVFGFAPVIGPTLSGIITDLLGWRDIFLILALVAIVAIIAGLFVVRDIGEHRRTSLDVWSAILFSLGLVFFMLGITGFEEYGLQSLDSYILVGGGVAMLVVFAFRQFKIESPYLNLALFKSHRFALGVILLVLAQIAMVSSALQTPLYIQEVHGLSAIDSGLTLLPGALCLPLLNPFTGRLYDRIGARPMGIIGFTLLLLGTSGFILFSPTTPIWLVAGLYALRMVGISFALMPMTAFALSDLSKADNPQGTAIINSFRQIMGSLGSSAMVAIVTAFSTDTAASAGVSMSGFSVSFGVMAGFLLVGLVLVLALVKPKKHKGHRKALD